MKIEFNEKRLSKLFIIGEANQHSNRMININEDLVSFTFKPTFKTNVILSINGLYKKYKHILNKLFILQKDKKIGTSRTCSDVVRVFITCQNENN